MRPADAVEATPALRGREQPYAGGVPIAEVLRSGFAESRHHGSVVVLDATGSLSFAVGDPHGAILPRSSNKPMQAVGLLRSGLAPADSAELALITASHSGEPMHIELVRALLGRGGLAEGQLRCPPDLPLSVPARAAVYASGGSASRIFMNCSGKHTGMLLTCQAAGWSLDDYLDPCHPVQRACQQAIEDLTGEAVSAITVDGCGAPALAISLVALARAFLRLVDAAEGTLERTVADAMRAHPEIVSGTDREDGRLMRGVPGLLAKVGAEGVIAVAAPGVGAVAVKVDDGADRARWPALIAAMRRLGIGASVLDELAEVAIMGGGEPVGSVRALH